MNVTFRPIDHWPREPRDGHDPSPYDSTYSKTMNYLKTELRMLGVEDVVIQVDVSEREIRKTDGFLSARARPRSPKVIVSFEVPGVGSRQFMTEKYPHWHDNLRAVAYALEDLRRLERNEVAQDNQQYRGFLALEASKGNVLEAQRILARNAGVVSDVWEEMDMETVYKMARKYAHPDAGGSSEAFNEVQEAWRVLGGGR